jgi:formylmethanofuran dehydrogenase subunit E
MYKLEEEEYLTIVFYFHKHKPPRTKFKRKTDLKEVGIFASRSPDRLSRIAVTDVKLNKIERMTLFVSGLDAINGTPVLDIKTSLRDKT